MLNHFNAQIIPQANDSYIKINDPTKMIRANGNNGVSILVGSATDINRYYQTLIDLHFTLNNTNCRVNIKGYRYGKQQYMNPYQYCRFNGDSQQWWSLNLLGYEYFERLGLVPRVGDNIFRIQSVSYAYNGNPGTQFNAADYYVGISDVWIE